jgi:magnesium chelatase family protein
MSKTYAAVLVGVEIEIIEVEAFVGNGFSGLTILGISGDVVRDMRERVRAVLESAGYALPARKIVVSFSPVRALKLCRTNLEELDFAVAACVVRALDEEKRNVSAKPVQERREFFAGALSLTGALRPVDRPLVVSALQHREWHAQTGAIFHVAHETEIGGSESVLFYPHFESWMAKRNGGESRLLSFAQAPVVSCDEAEFSRHNRLKKICHVMDVFSSSPKILAALLAAAAGRHNILFAGEPGVGKSFAIKHLEMLLPALTTEELFQVQLISDEQSLQKNKISSKRPFRAPHHSCTSAALVGGANLKPGEVTLAHLGVLFLDELAEFSRLSLEALREPLDSGKVLLSRAAGSLAFPARFQLCATTNPCPCGFLFSRKKSCRCSHGEKSRYLSRLSGPLMDRFGLQVVVEPDVLERDVFSRCLIDLVKEENRTAFAERFLSVQEQMFFGGPLECNASALGAKPASVSRRTEGHLDSLASTFLLLFPEAKEASWDDVASYRVMEQRFARIRS